MRIKKVSVRNFRKFLQPVTIADLHNGVCVIAGDNEEGKSTIVQAIKSAFHLKYNTTSTQHIQPYNSSGMPEVSVDFDICGTSYSLRKVFGRKGSAELRTDANVFQGSEAEERLQDLCNLGADRKESSIWNVLWVEQGTTAELKVGDVGKRTLQSALERELGSIVAGDEGQILFKNVKDLYLKWFTNTGRDSKHGEHKQAEEQLVEVSRQLSEAQEQLSTLQSMLSQLDAARVEMKQHEDKKTLEAAHKLLESLTQKRLQIDKQQSEYKQALQAESTEDARHQNAAAAWKQRSQLAQEADSGANRVKTIEQKIAEAKEKYALVTERLHVLNQKRADLEAAYEKATTECEEAEGLERLRQLHEQITAAEACLEKATKADELCEDIKTRGAAIKVDKAIVDSLRAIERQFLQLDAQLKAVATKLELRPNNGTVETKLVTERTAITLEGWGEIVVLPGAGDLEKLKASTDDLRIKLETGLATISVKTLVEAEELERQKTQLGMEWKAARADVNANAPHGIPALSEQVVQLKAQYEELQSKQSAGAQLNIFSLTAAAELLQRARTLRDTTKHELHQSKAGAELCEKEFRQAALDVQTLSGQLDSAQEELKRINDRLTEERGKQPDELLFQSLKETELRVQQAAKHRQELETKLKELRPESIELEITSAQKNIEQVRQEISQLKEVQNRLEGSLQTLGKQGITEEVERLRGKKEQFQSRYDRAAKRAAAIKLLHETLCKAELSSKQQLSEPLMRRLQPYIGELFAGSKFAFDNANFSIAELERNAAEPIQGLSLGTREQISVLTRLAFAEVLAESGAPSVVILDDALVYSDEVRFERMQEVLKRASEKFQIIIMTCRERDYANMGVPIIKLAECVGKAESALAIPASLPNVGVSRP